MAWPRDEKLAECAVENVIVVEGLRMRYGATEAVAGIDLRIARGEIFAFLGPNGAGKTTTVEILEGFRERTDGTVSVLGVDPNDGGREWRNRIGAVLQESSAEPGLTVRQCLQLYAGYYDNPRSIDETLALVGLAAKADARGEHLSGGQRRRLEVALALIGDPELLFLDEPTTGFDPSARRTAWSVIEGLRDLGKTVFLTTHYMDEAESLADRIAVITQGKIVAEGTPVALGGREAMPTSVSFRLPDGVEYPHGRRENDRVVLESRQPLSDVAGLAAWADAHRVEIEDLEVSKPSLEDVYLELTRTD
ncbi:MAG TPA: ABC transporter ATP-binding protein [Gaiellaceae bacterium]|nr:ABC transporter ATP-binding protein [Gaiellaceae bacterium]